MHGDVKEYKFIRIYNLNSFVISDFFCRSQDFLTTLRANLDELTDYMRGGGGGRGCVGYFIYKTKG